ncbi:hypothetical protein QMY54_00256 (plasmid) [Pseudomonas rhodesiae]|nr:hypothetical protein QMY54_00256 [Pseudomonas rhodesiae]
MHDAHVFTVTALSNDHGLSSEKSRAVTTSSNDVHPIDPIS